VTNEAGRGPLVQVFAARQEAASVAPDADSILEYLGEVTVAPVTSTVRDIPSEVRLDKKDGMPQDCAINFDHIQAVSKGRLGSLVTMLSAGRMREVSDAVALALGLGR
jgi:mRNA interferase MazF